MLDQLQLPYLIESSMVMVLGYLIYRLLFASDTSYMRNRIYLLALLSLSFLLPLISLPVYAKKVITVPLRTVEATSHSSAQIVQSSFEWSAILSMIYLVVALLLSLRLIYHVIHIFNVINKSEHMIVDGVKHIVTDQLNTPASIFNVLLTDKVGLPKAVIDHEKVHISHGHTWDVLFMEIAKIVLWFNPFVYLTSRALKDNHEYIADHLAAKASENILDYPSLLLQYAKSIKSPVLLNTFSTITKKRIIMLSKKSTNNPWKSFLMIPILCFMVSLFSCESYTVSDNPNSEISGNDSGIRIDTIITIDSDTGEESMTIEKVYVNEISTRVDTTFVFDYETFEESVVVVRSEGPRKEVLLETYTANEYNNRTGDMETNTYHRFPQELEQVIDTIVTFDYETYEEEVTIIEGARPREELVATKVTPRAEIKKNQQFDNTLRERNKSSIIVKEEKVK